MMWLSRGPDPVFERQLRSIADVTDWDEQRQLFRSFWHSQEVGGTFPQNV